MITVDNLRQLGFGVKVRHIRNQYFNNNTQMAEFEPRGGYTQVEIYDHGCQQTYTGIAECSKKDQYNRKLGVRIALGRALKSMSM